ncbi:hypothetical protein ACNHYB_12925 [Isoptericola jiangsuensis]|uniref:hypothetical protein n=1 Tax=Isoptericola jiangsuensis TaxID=548579 RepID=UPI003AAD6F8C
MPVDVSPTTYVDTLGKFLIEGLSAEPGIPLTDLLAQAIAATASQLDLCPGSSPSSTVAIVRQDGEAVDLLVLGDTQIATPNGIYVDDRIAHIAQQQRAAYQARLANGYGYDETHTKILATLQTEQARHRKVDGGYWIAEADPAAAQRAIMVQVGLETTPWLVLATDGAHRLAQKLGLDNWAGIAAKSSIELERLLNNLYRWESIEDPGSKEFPRAKRHDDKAIAAARLR